MKGMKKDGKAGMKLIYRKRILSMVILVALVIGSGGCGINTAGDVSDKKENAASVSESAVSASMAEPVVLSEVKKPLMKEERYGLMLPPVEDVLKEFEFLVYLDNKCMSGTAYTDLKKRGLLGVPMEVKVYCMFDIEEDYPLHYYHVLCEIAVQGKEKLYMMMACNQVGFESDIYNPEYEWETLGEGDIRNKEEKDLYTYLGKGTAYIDEETAKTFVPEWSHPEEKERRLERVKESIRKDCSDVKGKYRVYIDYFLPGDPVENGVIVSPVTSQEKDVYTLGTIALVHPSYDEGYDYNLRMGDKPERVLHGSGGGSSYDGSWKEMKERCDKDYEKHAIEIWEFEVK